jgi:mannose-6-phosphate isomerase-like protein (cupin superfamily)
MAFDKPAQLPKEQPMKLISVLAIAALAVPCYAQTVSHAQVFSVKDVSSQMAALISSAKASGSSGATLGDYQSHAIKLSVRTETGGAEVHAHYDDIFFVTQGHATLVTGGTVIDPRTGEHGETKGRGILHGRSQTIAKGDIVHIPAGTPHQIILAPGAVYASIVIKVREP